MSKYIRARDTRKHGYVLCIYAARTQNDFRFFLSAPRTRITRTKQNAAKIINNIVQSDNRRGKYIDYDPSARVSHIYIYHNGYDPIHAVT